MTAKISPVAYLFLLPLSFCLFLGAFPVRAAVEPPPGVLVFGVPADRPPVFSLDERGNLTGFGYDIASEIADMLGMKPHFRHALRLEQNLQRIEDGGVRILAAMPNTGEYSPYLRFSSPLLEMTERIFVRPESTGLSSLRSLYGRRVTCVDGEESHRYLLNFPEIISVPSRTLKEAVNTVLNGKADALISPTLLLTTELERDGKENRLVPAGPPLRVLEYCFAVKPENHELLARINAALASLRSSGRLNAIRSRWFGDNLLSGFSNTRLLIGGLTALLVITLASLSTSMIYFKRRLCRCIAEGDTVRHRLETRQRSMLQAIEEQADDLERSENDYSRLEREAARFFELSSEMFCIGSAEGRLHRVNPAWETALGYPGSEYLAHPITDFLHHEDGGSFSAALSSLATKMEASAFEARFRHSNGGWRILSWDAVFIESEGRFFANVHDITEQRTTETLLRNQAEELERANSELKAFVDIASHDLQEPLRKISGFLELLASRHSGDLPPEALEFIDYAVDGSRRLREMIGDLLALSRIRLRSEALREISLTETVREVILDLGILIEDTGAKINIGELPKLEADPEHMHLLFRHLIGNAVKYRSDRQPRIDIFASSVNGLHHISIRDNGIGIPPEEQDSVFNAFHRLHGNGERAGTGVGLAICRRIAELHSGTIQLKSTPGRGSTFRVTFPDRRSRMSPASGTVKTSATEEV